ncbi:MAG TPA: glycosyl hydrolase family 28 protein [Opitutaceae bacterium]|nr:glycosyl hydrolase family 28 protein [Opitutaceae bacterium]
MIRPLLLLALAAFLIPSTGLAALHRTITEFGAVADAKTLNTEAIQRAIDDVAKAGGGVVEIPQGTFLSGAIFLKSGVELFLGDGAVLQGSNRIEDYPKRETRIEGHFEPWRMALVNAQQMDRVRITGHGRLDGNGAIFWAAFWQRRKENPRCTNLEVERPRLMFIDRCKDVRIAGISLENSGFWNLHLYRCQDVTLEGLTIKAPSRGKLLAPSSDGIDIDSSQNIVVRKCKISVNDDNIALKGSRGPFADKDKDSPPVENIRVEDCEFGDGNGIITCGSEATLVRNVTVKNVEITGHTVLLNLKLRADTPQRYEHILIDGVKLSGEGQILRVKPWHQFFDLQGQPPPTRVVDDVVIRNVSGDYRAFGEIAGADGDTIRNVTLENFSVNLAKPKLLVSGAGVENLVFRNIVVNGKNVEAP